MGYMAQKTKEMIISRTNPSSFEKEEEIELSLECYYTWWAVSTLVFCCLIECEIPACITNWRLKLRTRKKKKIAANHCGARSFHCLWTNGNQVILANQNSLMPSHVTLPHSLSTNDVCACCGGATLKTAAYEATVTAVCGGNKRSNASQSQPWYQGDSPARS